MKIIKNSVNPCESVSEKLLCVLCVLCGYIFSKFSVALYLPHYICRASSTNPPFYAKRTQFVEAENALSLCTIKCYTKSTFLSKAKNKPKRTQTYTAWAIWAICIDDSSRRLVSPKVEAQRRRIFGFI